MPTQTCDPSRRTATYRVAKHVLVLAILGLILYFSLLMIAAPSVQ